MTFLFPTASLSKEDAMFLSRRIFYCAVLTLPLLLVLSCGSAHDSDEYYVFVSANLQVPYWKAAGAGFTNA
jgi:hypothetical protein